jgi:hypothetical protein
MKRALAVLALTAASVMPVLAQVADPAPPMNNADKVSWDLLALVAKPAGSNVVFETWASNEDTFQPTPKFPGSSTPPNCGPQVAAAPVQPAAPGAAAPGISPKILNVRALEAFAPGPAGPRPEGAPGPANPRMEVVPGGTDEEPSEEVRRNKAAFDFIVCNKLFTKAGLRVAFASGQAIAFPFDSIEVKANWVPLGTRNPANYYVNTADGKKYALVAMHIISKEIPNWTWATFEHKDNPGRCDYIGCHDRFGAVVADVEPHDALGTRYDPCVKTPALKKVFTDAGLPPLWENYCLKGSQTDFVTATGIPTRLGNSVTESNPRGTFVDTSSCMACHARSAVNANGRPALGAGFVSPPDPAVCPGGTQRSCSPNGAPNPAMFWNNLGQPTQTLRALQTDFVFSLALRAIGQ